MDCPRCKTQLSVETLKDEKISFDIDTCSDCGGTWFDKGELFKIDEVIEPTFLEIRKIPRKSEQLEALYCPACSSHP